MCVLRFVWCGGGGGVVHAINVPVFVHSVCYLHRLMFAFFFPFVCMLYTFHIHCSCGYILMYWS